MFGLLCILSSIFTKSEEMEIKEGESGTSSSEEERTNQRQESLDFDSEGDEEGEIID